MNDDSREINVRPTKQFFIETLTRDIDLIDAIMDLIDNSVDGFIVNDFDDRREIKIEFSENYFMIKDNCGGINKEKVYEHVFRLGKPSDIEKKTIGVFGIGLKRAIFKIGKNVQLLSDDGENFYSIKITEDWINNEDKWVLDFEEEDETKGEKMTKVEINNIYPDISDELSSTTFENEIIKKIKNTYSLFIEKGIDIYVNENKVDHYYFEFLADDDFYPFHKKYKTNNIEYEIYAGFNPHSSSKKPHGWFVFCNDRLILRNDTTNRTG